jgi:hypothetical protein
MFRSILGFAILAVLAWIGLKIIFGLLGGLFGLASPSTADKVRDTIKGKRDTA